MQSKLTVLSFIYAMQYFVVPSVFASHDSFDHKLIINNDNNKKFYHFELLQAFSFVWSYSAISDLY